MASTLLEVDRSRSRLDAASERQRDARARLEADLIAAVLAGETQRAVAAAAGVSQPYVSQVVQRLRGRFVAHSRLGCRLAGRRDAVIAAAARQGVTELAVFGSVARGEDGPDSDIDLAATVPATMGLLGLARLEQELTALLGTPVDLVPRHLLDPRVARTAADDLVPL